MVFTQREFLLWRTYAFQCNRHTRSDAHEYYSLVCQIVALKRYPSDALAVGWPPQKWTFLARISST
jgi:hypothetical protein